MEIGYVPFEGNGVLISESNIARVIFYSRYNTNFIFVYNYWKTFKLKSQQVDWVNSVIEWQGLSQNIFECCLVYFHHLFIHITLYMNNWLFVDLMRYVGLMKSLEFTFSWIPFS